MCGDIERHNVNSSSTRVLIKYNVDKYRAQEPIREFGQRMSHWKLFYFHNFRATCKFRKRLLKISCVPNRKCLNFGVLRSRPVCTKYSLRRPGYSVP